MTNCEILWSYSLIVHQVYCILCYVGIKVGRHCHRLGKTNSVLVEYIINLFHQIAMGGCQRESLKLGLLIN